MITTTLATTKEKFRERLNDLKVMQKCIFSQDEIDYLSNGINFECVELKQEDEDDDEFLKLFSTWLHERPKRQGYVDYYIIVCHRKGEHLTPDQFEYMERNVAECFDTSHGWLYEINHRMRFRLRIQLICSYKKEFHRLTRKELGIWK